MTAATKNGRSILINKLKSLGAGAHGVDIGCGNGYFTRALARAGYSVSGIDISPEMLNKAKALSLKEGICAEFLLGDITKLKLNAVRTLPSPSTIA